MHACKALKTFLAYLNFFLDPVQDHRCYGIIDSSSTKGSIMEANIKEFYDHVQQQLGTAGKEFTPTHAELQKDGFLVITGTCPEFNNEEDEICVEWCPTGCFKWVDMDGNTPLVEEAYDTMVNYIGRLAKTKRACGWS
jgi:hypothetical protein